MTQPSIRKTVTCTAIGGTSVDLTWDGGCESQAVVISTVVVNTQGAAPTDFWRVGKTYTVRIDA